VDSAEIGLEETQDRVEELEAEQKSIQASIKELDQAFANRYWRYI